MLTGSTLPLPPIANPKNEGNRVFDKLDMGWTRKIRTDQEKQRDRLNRVGWTATVQPQMRQRGRK